MANVMNTPVYTGGFIENLNLVAKHIRSVDTSIYEEVNVYIELSRRWAMEAQGIEVDPINYPGYYSSFSYSRDAILSAQQAQATADSILDLTVDEPCKHNPPSKNC